MTMSQFDDIAHVVNSLNNELKVKYLTNGIILDNEDYFVETVGDDIDLPYNVIKFGKFPIFDDDKPQYTLHIGNEEIYGKKHSIQPYNKLESFYSNLLRYVKIKMNEYLLQEKLSSRLSEERYNILNFSNLNPYNTI